MLIRLHCEHSYRSPAGELQFSLCAVNKRVSLISRLLCCTGYFEMPYHVAGDDMLVTLRQKCALLKQRLHILETTSRMYLFQHSLTL